MTDCKMTAERISPRGVMFGFDTYDRYGYGLHAYFIEGDKTAFLIDTGCGDAHAKLMRDYIAARCPLPITVINTHHHYDHIFGNCGFDDCMIISSNRCFILSDTSFARQKESSVEFIAGNAVKRLPDKTFDKTLHIADEGLILTESFGHTADGIVIFDERDKVLYVGDNIADTNEDVFPELECPRSEYASALRTMLEFDFHTAASGHNSPQPRSFIEQVLCSLT